VSIYTMIFAAGLSAMKLVQGLADAQGQPYSSR